MRDSRSAPPARVRKAFPIFGNTIFHKRVRAPRARRRGVDDENFFRLRDSQLHARDAHGIRVAKVRFVMKTHATLPALLLLSPLSYAAHDCPTIAARMTARPAVVVAASQSQTKPATPAKPRTDCPAPAKKESAPQPARPNYLLM